MIRSIRHIGGVMAFIVGAAATLASAQAATVNVDFSQNAASNGYSGQGALATAGNTWNNIGATSTSATGLLDSEGSATSIGFVRSGTVTGNGNLPVAGRTNLMTQDYWYVTNSNFTVTVNGLTAGALYDLYVYAAQFGTNRGSTVTVGGTPKPVSGVGVQLTTPPYNENVSHAVFTGVAASAGGEIAIVISAGAVDGIGFLNGLQIAPSAIPEPASLVLISAGALFVLRRRR